MKLRTAIVEDRKPDAERLEQLLKKAFENENISCSCFASGDEFLRAGWREGYQVVFLDICMEGTNGIETAQRLRAADPDLLIVFVTFRYIHSIICSSLIRKKSLSSWQGSCGGCCAASSQSWRCALPGRSCGCR